MFLFAKKFMQYDFFKDEVQNKILPNNKITIHSRTVLTFAQKNWTNTSTRRRSRCDPKKSIGQVKDSFWRFLDSNFTELNLTQSARMILLLLFLLALYLHVVTFNERRTYL